MNSVTFWESAAIVYVAADSERAGLEVCGGSREPMQIPLARVRERGIWIIESRARIIIFATNI